MTPHKLPPEPCHMPRPDDHDDDETEGWACAIVIAFVFGLLIGSMAIGLLARHP